MKTLLVILAAILTCLHEPEACAAKQDLVLVAANNTEVKEMSPDEVRRLYIGVPIEVDGHFIDPLINATDNLVQEIFMQQVLFMSTEIYMRRNVVFSYRKGEIPSQLYSNLPSLIAVLKTNRYAVTYMLRSIAVTIPELKIITELWRGED